MNRTYLTNLLLAAALAAILASSTAAAVIRVKWDSPDDGPGNDWAHAYHTVTAAIAAAVAGDQVWVAGGHTYEEEINVKAGLALYGGFVGTETTPEARQPRANETTLAGYWTGNETTPLTFAPGATATTVLDGFYAACQISCVSSSPAISNNIMVYTYGNGGVALKNSNAILRSNVFRHYGIWCNGGSPSILNNTFTAKDYLTGVSCGSACSATIANNLICGRNTGIDCYDCSPTITNNTIVQCRTGVDTWRANPKISNNIIALCTDGVYMQVGPAPGLYSNCVYNPDGTNYTGLASGATDICIDPLFQNSTGGDFHLTSGSPCIGAGLDSAVEAGWVDIDGQTRVWDGHVDIGADENMVPCVVWDDGLFTYSLSTLHARWTTVDPPTGVAAYRYAIGTAPDAPQSTLIVPWTSAGTATETTVNGLALELGKTYYWYVQAKTLEGLWGAVGVSDGISAAAQHIDLLGQTRALSAGTGVSLDQLVASTSSADYPGFVFLQDPGRATGIRVNTTAQINRGDRVSVAGRVEREGGEWQINAFKVPGVVAGPEPAPLHLTQRSLAYDLNEDLAPDNGLDPTGLLVTVAGRITRVNTTFHVLYIDDGAGLADGMGPSDYPYVGLRVSYRTFVPPAVGKRVAITGILRVEKTTLEEDAFVNGEYRRAGETLYLPVVWPRTAADIVVLF